MMAKIHKKKNKILRIFCLTKEEKRDIIIKLSDERTTAKNIFKKSLKKDLTNFLKCDIINELPRKAGRESQEEAETKKLSRFQKSF